MKLRRSRYKPYFSFPCPHCDKRVESFRFSGMSDMSPHFYCDKCSNVFFTQSHRDLLYRKRVSEELLSEIASSLPKCTCGGQFAPGANPRCPHCGQQIELHSGASSLKRLSDPIAFIFKGAYLVQPEDD